MRWMFAAAFAGLAIGCTTHDDGSHNDDGAAASPGRTSVSGSGSGSDAGSGSGSGSGMATTCTSLGAPGTFVSTANISGGGNVATDARGDVFYTSASGIAELDPSGTLVFTYPYGSALAVDASGDFFVTGSFTTPTDFGLGTIQPMGNIDVFVVELNTTGHVVFAKALGLCGDGVDSIAVDRSGRIAISGTAMGTAVLDNNGNLVFDAAVAGQVAFDSTGDLFVGGSFVGSLDLGGGHVLTAASASDTDGFFVELDRSGAYLASAQLGDVQLPAGAPPSPQLIASIAIDSHDDLALFGTFEGEMDLFGKRMQTLGEGPSGTLAGLFAAKLDPSLAVVFAEQVGLQYQYNPPGAIAVDLAGNVLVSTNAAADESAPNAYPQLYRLDATTGAMLPGGFTRTDLNSLGYGLGVAADVCGNVLWADTEQSSPLVALQPLLRKVAE